MSKAMKSSNWIACYLERLLLSTAACGVRRIVAMALSTVLLQGTASFVPAYSKDTSVKSSKQVLLPVKELEQKFLKSVSQAKDSGNRDAVLKALLETAEFYVERGNHAGVEAVCKELLALPYDGKSQLAAKSRATAFTLLGKLYRSRMDPTDPHACFEQVDACFEQALKINEQVYGPNHLEVGKALYLLGLSYQWHAKHAPVERLFRRSMKIMKLALKNNPDQVDALRVVSYFYLLTGKEKQSIQTIRRALLASQSPKFPDKLIAVEILDDMAQRCCFASEIESLYKRALLIVKTQAGPKAPQIVRVYNSLGSYYLSPTRVVFSPSSPNFVYGRLKEAESAYLAAKSVGDQVLYPDSYQVGITLDGLAQIADIKGDHGNATRLQEKALSVFQKFYPAESTCLSNHYRTMARRYEASGDLAKSKHFDELAQKLELRARALPYPPRYVLEL